MDKDNFLRIAKESGFESIEGYVGANLKHLSPEMQRLYRMLYPVVKNNGKN